MYLRLLAILVSVACSTWLLAQTGPAVVLDSISRKPLANASVLDRNGKVVGVTDSKGLLPYAPYSDYPLSVHYMGYRTAAVEKPSSSEVLMKESVSLLPELVVSAKNRKFLHIMAVVREYSTLSTYSDTVFLFRDKLVDFMVPVKDDKSRLCWTEPRLLKCKSYYRFTDSNGLDSVSNYFPEHFSWSDWIGISRRIVIPEVLRNVESGNDTIRGKHSPKSIWHKANERVSLDVDILADSANYRFVPSLSGFFKDMDFRRLSLRYVFDDVYGDVALADNITSMSFNIESNGRGRNLKRLFHSDGQAYVETYAEVFIVDKMYLSSKEAKLWQKTPPASSYADIMAQRNLPPLPRAMQRLVERVDNIDYDYVRMSKKPDRRYIRKYQGGKKGIADKLKSVFKL